MAYAAVEEAFARTEKRSALLRRALRTRHTEQHENKERSMTHEFKRGDKAMVEIAGVDRGGLMVIGCPTTHDKLWSIPLSCLHPLPPAQSPEERAVVERSIAYEEALADNATPAFNAWRDATRALIASRTPPDPLALMAELVAAYDDMASGCVGSVETSMRRQGRFGSALDAARAAVVK